jgi:hypoxia up-regulated 1
MCSSVALAFVTFFAASANAQKSAVLGIDLGSQFFKLAVVKTGGFDVVMSEASKRKTAMSMAVVDGERFFGDAAMSQKGRRPKEVMIGMPHLIGKTFDAKIHEKHGFGGYHLPYKFEKDATRGTVVMDVNGVKWSPDEVMGMVFSYMKDMSQKFIEGTVTECVITVPPYLTEHERRMIIDAAYIADLSVLMLVNDNTAVAIRYGIEKQTPPGVRNNVLFVDVGAVHTTATVATYEEKNITSYKKVPSVQIQAVKWSYTGGSNFDEVLTNYFADEFDKKYKKKIRDNLKAIAKLRTATEKIKTVLSANKETLLMVESLMDDIDFKLKITREELEKMGAKLFDDIEAPIKAAIEASGLKLDEIHEVIPFGAGTRVPKVKELVLKTTKREKWQPSINTDEASALGAAFVAANFSKSFRLREFHVYDQFQFSIGIDLNGKKATLFKPQSVMQAKKTITQPLSDEAKEADFIKIGLNYDDAKLLPPGTPTGLASYNITGMKAALAKHNVTGTPKVAIAVGLHRDSIVDVLHADLKVHSMDWVKKQRFVKKNVTEEVSTKVPLNVTNETAKTDAKAADVNETNGSNGTVETPKNYTYVKKNVTREKTVEVTEEKLEKKLHYETLTVTRNHEGVPRLTEEEFKAASDRHEKFFAEEKERNARAAAKNDVEAWIFASRDKLSAEKMDIVSTEDERSKATAALSAAEDWLWEDGDNVNVTVYQDKKAELTKGVSDMFFRHAQLAAREEAIKTFKEALADAAKRTKEWVVREEKRMARNDTTWIHVNETKRLTKMCNESSTWLQEKEVELKKVGLLVKPPFTAHEILQYIKPVQNEVAYLRYKPKPRSKVLKKKKKKTNSTASNSSNATANATANTTAEPKDAKKAEKKDEL